jgi:hypothetical protein
VCFSQFSHDRVWGLECLPARVVRRDADDASLLDQVWVVTQEELPALLRHRAMDKHHAQVRHEADQVS